MRELIPYVRYVGLVLLFLVAIRLFTTRLAYTYRWLTAVVITDLVLTLLFQIIPNGTNRYAETFFAVQPIRWIVYVGVICELYSLVLTEHSGILAFGRRWLIRALGIAALFSVSTLFVHLGTPSVEHPFLDSYHVVERLVYVCLFLFLILLIAMLAWFPIQLKRNVVVLCAVFGGYLLVRSGVALTRNIGGLQTVATLNQVLEFVTPACAFLWLVLCHPSGEYSRLRVGHPSNHADEARILAQLNAINASLLRSARE